MRTLVIDTATAACSVALVEDGRVIASTHEIVGRGHAERLVPMIAELPDGGRADHVLVDCGPGSFTGVRVGVAAARGLGLGWSAGVSGFSSMASIAASALSGSRAGVVAVILEGGHGEVFMQGFAVSPLATSSIVATSELVSLKPADALAALDGRRAIGNGVGRLLAVDAAVDAIEMLPNAADAVLLPETFATLAPRPIYGRAPDAKLPANAIPGT